MSVSCLELYYCTVYLKFCQKARSHVKCSYQNKKEKSLPSWRPHSWGWGGAVVIGATEERKGEGIGEHQGGVQFYIGCWRRLGWESAVWAKTQRAEASLLYSGGFFPLGHFCLRFWLTFPQIHSVSTSPCSVGQGQSYVSYIPPGAAIRNLAISGPGASTFLGGGRKIWILTVAS